MAGTPESARVEEMRKTHSTAIRRNLSRRRFVGLGVVMGLVSFAVGDAQAHAVVVESKPKPGELLGAPDQTFRLRFNSRIDVKRSRLVLVTPDRKERNLVILDESTQDTLVSRATKLDSGAYRLRWQVLAIDGHLTRGDINFTVR
jgi:methionine-rich copper-binding protein CopC